MQLKSNEQPTYNTVWMQYAELELMMAEAYEKGWISGGTGEAEKHYKARVKASHDYWQSRVEFGLSKGLDLVAMEDFNDDYFLKDEAAYSGNKLQKIYLQMWLSQYNNIEGYFQWRRTGFPELIPGAETQNGQKIPVRLNYPVTTKANNEDNYKAAVARQGADDLNTRMWLIK
jgi:hypothetical protein